MRASIAALVATALVIAPTVAGGATITVANNCTGQPSPCTTNLQTALDDGQYATVSVVANATFTGDYLIDRSLTLTGASGATIERPSGGDYALRVESTGTVTVEDFTITGRVAVYASSSVDLVNLDISGGTVGVQINDSDTVEVRSCTTDATDRAVDVLDSAGVTITGGTHSSDAYAVVGSASTVTVDDTTVDGATNSVVLQEGNDLRTPSLTATDATFVTGAGNDHVWAWDRASTSYSGCTPTSPSEDLSASGDLIDLLSYEPWGGT